MQTTKKPVTNEEILANVLDLSGNMHDLMQMTADGFERLDGRMDRLEVRMDSLDGRMDKMETRLSSIENILRDHGQELARLSAAINELTNNHKAYMNDVADILSRLVELEKQFPNLSKKDVREMQQLLQALVDWAIEAAKITDLPLKLPK